MLARKLIWEGGILCPLPWRGGNARVLPSISPTTSASEGFPPPPVVRGGAGQLSAGGADVRSSPFPGDGLDSRAHEDVAEAVDGRRGGGTEIPVGGRVGVDQGGLDAGCRRPA